jgi:hypothetical protein
MAGALRNMAAPGPGVCPICWTFHDPAFAQCISCVGASQLDVMVPISYAPRGDQLALALRGYKDEYLYATRYHHAMRLAAILWRFLMAHEGHVARASGTESFSVVAVVPSKTTQNDESTARTSNHRRDGRRAHRLALRATAATHGHRDRRAVLRPPALRHVSPAGW